MEVARPSFEVIAMAGGAGADVVGLLVAIVAEKLDLVGVQCDRHTPEGE